MDVVAAWAAACGSALHVGVRKTVVMCHPPVLPSMDTVTYNGQLLSLSSSHRWLGMVWASDLDFTSFLQSRLQVAQRMLAQLAGLASLCALPWLAVCELFETKVDSILDMGRWIFIMVPNAAELLDRAYDNWGRTLLGADWFRNAAVSGSECGWVISGFARVVRAVALRRARLFSRGDSDWHASFFFLANKTCLGWAQRGAAILREWSIDDWPAWHAPDKTLAGYKMYVSAQLQAACRSSWLSVASCHRANITYTTFAQHARIHLRQWRSLGLPHDALLSMRSLCRLRAGLITLTHLGGKQSGAVHQSCIFCGGVTAKSTVHCLSLCGFWTNERCGFVRSSSLSLSIGNHNFAVATLRGDLSVEALSQLIRWANSIDKQAYDFWRTRV